MQSPPEENGYLVRREGLKEPHYRKGITYYIFYDEYNIVLFRYFEEF